MVRNDSIALLKEHLSFWKELTREQQKNLEQSILKKNFSKGEIMSGGSENCAGLFLILSGQVRAYIVSESGREITLYRLFDRDVCLFSASCMLKDITFDIYNEVEKDTEAYLIPTAVVRRLAKEAVAVQSFMNQLMASRFSEVMWILEQALFTSVDKRLASYLLEQINIQQTNAIKVTHEKIANDLGTAREVVTRMLKYFQNEFMVSLSRGVVEVINKDKIEKLLS
ncbi:MAG: Crp/Fnr family transcriptional regulator [Clostridiales bacterium]|jgi:CRP/FNR family transcriptional regulator|nr:Crp/Fnr family transcriptional regulator [Clostridiales bacterium]